MLWSTLVGKAPEQAQQLYEQQQTYYTQHKHAYKHTPAHTLAHTCKVALGEWEAQWKLWVMSTPFAILNLNHCGIESLQGFLCVHLRVCICKRGQARSTVGTVYLRTCVVLFCMCAQALLISLSMQHMFTVYIYSTNDTCLCFLWVCFYINISHDRKPLLWEQWQLYTILSRVARWEEKRREEKLSLTSAQTRVWWEASPTDQGCGQGCNK